MTITIDGKPCACQSGEYLLDIASRNGIAIPTLCHHVGLAGRGCCRVCVVEILQDGKSSIVAACIYPVERECTVHTASDRVLRQRRITLSLLRAQAPMSNEVARLCHEYEAPARERFAVEKPDGKCILCTLCVKACESLGTGAIWSMNRGISKTISTPYDEASPVCVGCKSCAEVCPTGAIEASETSSERTIWGKTLPLKKCERCNATMGTYYELTRASERAESESPALCDKCRQKTISDVLAATYGA